MEFLIISGLSGAGKSRTMDILEDLNYYCVDNMPVVLIPKFAELCLATRSRYGHVALVTDVRERQGAAELFKALDDLCTLGCDYKILFVEADTETIVKRYKETRRRHPLTSEGGTIGDAVKKEIQLMSQMRERADYIINTTGLTLGMLQNKIYGMFLGTEKTRNLVVNVMSFGFKYGIPIEADLVFDVRFLPNPFYVQELKDHTGMEEPVYNYVFSHAATSEFMRYLTDMIQFLLPLYIEEGKHSLTVAIGCTGGRHRSVAIAKALSEFIDTQGHKIQLIHRDMQRG